MLIEEMKKKKLDMCEEILKRCHIEGNDFLYSIVMGDETWVFHYDPEN